MPNFIKYWFPVLGYSAIIFYMSSLPNVKTPMPMPNFDKVIHLAEYMPFGLLLTRAVTSGKKILSLKSVFGWVLFLTALYALSDEYHQSFVAGRTSSAWDALADVLGGSIGAYFYPYISTVKSKIL